MTKSRVLLLADVLDTTTDFQMRATEAAIELRRLHEVNQELLEALGLADAMLRGAHMNANVVHKKVSATIAKATGGQQ